MSMVVPENVPEEIKVAWNNLEHVPKLLVDGRLKILISSKYVDMIIAKCTKSISILGVSMDLILEMFPFVIVPCYNIVQWISIDMDNLRNQAGIVVELWYPIINVLGITCTILEKFLLRNSRFLRATSKAAASTVSLGEYQAFFGTVGLVVLGQEKAFLCWVDSLVTR